MKIKLLIVDDHQLFLDGLKALFEGHKEFTIVSEALNGKEALNELKKIMVDVILMDLNMPVMNGYEATKKILSHFPKIKIIVLSNICDEGIYSKMLNVGVHGYLTKTIGKDELFKAIKKVVNGKKYFCSEVILAKHFSNSSNLLSFKERPDKLIPLTVRETEILILIAQGYSNSEIGKKINISYRTVDNHRTNIMKKLKVHNIAGIIRYAFNNKLID